MPLTALLEYIFRDVGANADTIPGLNRLFYRNHRSRQAKRGTKQQAYHEQHSKHTKVVLHRTSGALEGCFFAIGLATALALFFFFFLPPPKQLSEL